MSRCLIDYITRLDYFAGEVRRQLVCQQNDTKNKKQGIRIQVSEIQYFKFQHLKNKILISTDNALHIYFSE
jgi:hypothetical protein